MYIISLAPAFMEMYHTSLVSMKSKVKTPTPSTVCVVGDSFRDSPNKVLEHVV